MSDPTDQEMLSAYLAAEQALITGGNKAVYLGERRVFKNDLQWIQEGVQRYRTRVNNAARVASGNKLNTLIGTFSQDRWYRR